MRTEFVKILGMRLGDIIRDGSDRSEFWERMGAFVAKNEPIRGPITGKDVKRIGNICLGIKKGVGLCSEVATTIELIRMIARKYGRKKPLACEKKSFCAGLRKLIRTVLAEPSNGTILNIKIKLVDLFRELFEAGSSLCVECAVLIVRELILGVDFGNECEEFVDAAGYFVCKAAEVAGVAIRDNGTRLCRAAMTCQNPAQWMKVMEMLWSGDVFRLVAKDHFIDSLPVLAERVGECYVLAMDVHQASCINGHGNVLLMGSNVLWICGPGEFLKVPFEAIDNLELTTNSVLKIGVSTGIIDNGEISLQLARKPSSGCVETIFFRISGEDASNVFFGPEPEYAKSMNKNRMKASMVMFEGSSTPTPVENDCISKYMEQSITSPDRNLRVGLHKPSNHSSLAMYPRKCVKKSETENVDLTDYNAFFTGMSNGIAMRLSSSFQSFTWNRKDDTCRFNRSMAARVSLFRDSIDSTTVKRQYGPVQVIESAKDKFHLSVLDFKKKTNAIQQSIAHIEADTQTMSTRISEIRREIESAVHDQHIDVRTAIEGLRKRIFSKSINS